MSKEKNKGTYSNRHTTVVISEGGEVQKVIESTNTVRLFRAEKQFFNTFHDFIDVLRTMTKSQIIAMLYLLDKSEMDKCIVQFSPKTTKDMAAAIGFANTRNVSGVLMELRKQDMVRKMSRSTYMINPNYGFKGSLAKRSNVEKKYYAVQDEVAEFAYEQMIKQLIKEQEESK